MVEVAAIDIGPDLDRPHAKITDYVLEFRDREVRMLHRQRPHGFEPVGHDARRLRQGLVLQPRPAHGFLAREFVSREISPSRYDLPVDALLL